MSVVLCPFSSFRLYPLSFIFYPSNMRVYLEFGKKKVGVSAVDWPGLSRTAKTEEAALDMLLSYGSRYATVLHAAGIDFAPPSSIEAFDVVERIEGDAGTDFGGPAAIPSFDSRDHIMEDESILLPQLNILRACWAGFDRAAEDAVGKELRKGPRGGGRDLNKMIAHVVEAEQAYIRRIAAKVPKMKDEPLHETLQRTRVAIEEALFSAVRNGLPEKGPRGGKIWTPQAFIRRAAWHLLDHLWEIEDRIAD
ncbi:MAG: DinB family protein [Chloroflexota bacterium]